MFRKLIKFVFIICLFILPKVAWGAVLYFDPVEDIVGVGKQFATDIKIDINSGCINTIDGYIEFPSDHIIFEKMLTGDSLINIWVEKPNSNNKEDINKKGIIHFSGGIPGGYCGRIPGDPGDSNIIGKLIFVIPKFSVTDEEKSVLELNFTDQTKVYLNDGFGTEDILTTRKALIKKAGSNADNQDWNKLIATDRTKPNPFVIELRKDDSVYEGQYYIVFSTIDKQSGIDRYEVVEILPNEEIGVAPELKWWERMLGKKNEAPNWKIAKTPYLLKDQTLSSIIKVRAIDIAGNDRIVEYIPDTPAKNKSKFNIDIYLVIAISIIAVIVLSLIVILILIIKKIKNRKKYDEKNQKNIN